MTGSKGSGCCEGFHQVSDDCFGQEDFCGSRSGLRNLKLDESCSSKSNIEISEWTRAVEFELSTYDFEVQDSSNFKSSSPRPWLQRRFFAAGVTNTE